MSIKTTITHTLSGGVMDEKKVLETFNQHKIMTIDQLTHLLQSSVVTVRRRLKKWHTFTSINQNGRYYTLPDIPFFNEHGLWSYQAVLFSKHGNLKQTILWLIHQSQSGLSAGEIAKIVNLSPNSSFFTQLKNASGIIRKKHHGRFVYFSDRPQHVQRQINKRILRQSSSLEMPTDADAVVILVELIKHSGISIKQLTAKVQKKGRKIDSSVILRFLESHDLLKKTLDTGR